MKVYQQTPRKPNFLKYFTFLCRTEHSFVAVRSVKVRGPPLHRDRQPNKTNKKPRTYYEIRSQTVRLLTRFNSAQIRVKIEKAPQIIPEGDKFSRPGSTARRSLFDILKSPKMCSLHLPSTNYIYWCKFMTPARISRDKSRQLYNFLY